MNIHRYIRVWFRGAMMVLQNEILTPWSFLAFLTGKVLRFVLFFVFLSAVFGNGISLLHYSREEVIIFFLVFNLVDISGQFFFRGVYMFKPLVISGDFDYDLIKPLPTFFLPIFGWSDIIDLVTLIPLWIIFIFYYFTNIESASMLLFAFFLLLFCVAMLIAFALHLLVASLAIITLSGDRLLDIYRDTLEMVRYPADIYRGFVRYAITYVIPVVLIATIPAKTLLGYFDFESMLFSLCIGIVFFIFSILLWKYAVRRYASASS